MRMRKGLRKSVAALLALCMTLTMVPAVFAEGEGETPPALDITGVAVADGYSAELARDVNGDIVVRVAEDTLGSTRNVDVTLKIALPEGVAGTLTIAPKEDAAVPGDGNNTSGGEGAQEAGVGAPESAGDTPAAGQSVPEVTTPENSNTAEPEGAAVPAAAPAAQVQSADTVVSVPFDTANNTATFNLTLPEVALNQITSTSVYTLTYETGENTANIDPLDVTFKMTAVPLFQIKINSDGGVYTSYDTSSIYTETNFNAFGAYSGRKRLEDTAEPEDENTEGGDGGTDTGTGGEDGDGDNNNGGDGNNTGGADNENSNGTDDENGSGSDSITSDDTDDYDKNEGLAALQELHATLKTAGNSSAGYGKAIPFQIIVNGPIPAGSVQNAVLMFKINEVSGNSPVLLSHAVEYYSDDYALYNVLRNIGLVTENAKTVTTNNAISFNNTNSYTGYWGAPGGIAVTATAAGTETVTYPRAIDQWASLNGENAFRFFANVAGTYNLTVALVNLDPLAAPAENELPMSSFGYQVLASSSSDIDVSNYSSSSGGGRATKYTITATAGDNGSISPKTITLGHGGSHTFKITPNSGYEVDDVLVDGKSVGAVESYTFSSVKSNHTIKATFVTKGSKDKDKDSGVSVSDFNDVKSSDWFYDAVDYATKNGLFAGTTTKTFSPNENMTRGMFVAVLGRMADNMGIDTSGYNPAFSDVSNSIYYGKYVGWAAENDIVAGYSSTSFAPNDNITREQMAALFIRFAEYAKVDLKTSSSKTFTDSSSVSSWAVSDVNKAAAAGLITGYTDNSFRPQGTATRAEVCTVFMQFCQEYVDEADEE